MARIVEAEHGAPQKRGAEQQEPAAVEFRSVGGFAFDRRGRETPAANQQHECRHAGGNLDPLPGLGQEAPSIGPHAINRQAQPEHHDGREEIGGELAEGRCLLLVGIAKLRQRREMKGQIS